MASQRPSDRPPPAPEPGEAPTTRVSPPHSTPGSTGAISGDAPTLVAVPGAVNAVNNVSGAPTLAMPVSPAVTSTPEAPGPVLSFADDLSVSQGAARYEPGPLLGAGGMGEVRLHVDRRIGRRIAKKTLHATMDSEAARARFVREVRIQGQLEHPAIVPVYDLDVDEQGQTYFTMKRVRGQTLEQVIQILAAGDGEHARRFTRRRLLTAFAQVCMAVHYAHTRGVLHRDLKPGNIMLGDFGEVYVLDWGLAKITSEHATEPASSPAIDEPPVSAPGPVVGASGSLTVAGALFGTLAYMAPEQILGQVGEPDRRADIYALGAILFEILTKTRVRRGTDLAAVVREIGTGKVPSPSEIADEVPPELDALCLRALALDPEDRPATAREIAEEVERYLDGEQDLRLRHELAKKHAASARRRIDEAPREAKGAAQVEALRESMKALALDAEQPEAQGLLLSLLTGASGELPPEAQKDMDASIVRAQTNGARLGFNGLIAWLMMLPVAILIGVKSWLPVIGLSLFTLAGALLCRRMARRPSHHKGDGVLLAVLMALVIALTSSYLGPFALMPTCAATIAILFANSSRREDRPLLGGIVTAGALLPFLLEMTHLVPRAYAFEPGRVVIMARAIELPALPTMAAMIYSTLSFTVLATVFVGRMRDTITSAEERHLLQAWYLRQLFPAAAFASHAAGSLPRDKERSS
ncbi:MAG: serine/threonine-protein kinase [Byssovorax sp.]